VGVKADTTDALTQYLANGTEVQLPITTSAEDCCEFFLLSRPFHKPELGNVLPPRCNSCALLLN
jgi:hypothetical protein